MVKQWLVELAANEELATIYEQFRENNNETLQNLNTYLEDNPNQQAARLLKAQICLAWRLNNQYGFVAQMLKEELSPEFAGWMEHLRVQAEETAGHLVSEGQTHLKRGDLGKASAEFERAMLLAPHSAQIAYACGSHLASWDSNAPAALPEKSSSSVFGSTSSSRFGSPSRLPREREQDILKNHTVKYLRTALKLSPASSPLYHNTAQQLARHAVAADMIQLENVQPLLLLPHTPDTDPLLDQINAAIAERASSVITILLQVRETRLAAMLLQRLRKAAPALNLLPVLQAELARQQQTWDKAEQFYRRAGKTPRRQQNDTQAALELLKRVERLKMTCPSCGKRHTPDVKCTLCSFERPVEALLAERYPVDDVVLLGGIGLAEVYEQLGNYAAALEQIDAVLDKLPVIHPATINLRVFHNRLHNAGQSDDPVSRLIRHVDEDGVDAAALYWLEQLLPHTDLWLTQPLACRLMIAQKVMQAGYLRQTQKLMPVLFTDNPNRAAVRRVQSKLDHLIQERVEQIRCEAETLYAPETAEACIQRCSEALELIPREPALLLLRGQARILAGHDAPALDDLYQTLENSHDDGLTLATQESIAFLLERRWDLDGALEVLRSISPADKHIKAIQDRIERRKRIEPFMLLKRSESVLTEDTLQLREASGHISAYFAILVSEVSRPNSYSPAWHERLLNAGFEFTQILGAFRDMALDVTFALRFIAYPVQSNASQGRMKVALVARITGQDKNQAQDRALNIYSDIMASLPLTQEGVYTYEPVVDENELQELLLPFEPGHMAEIVRRETDPDQHGIYTVAPFTPGTLDMHNLFWTLLRQSAPSMLSIHLKPTQLYAWDKQVATTQQQFMLPDFDPFVEPNGAMFQAAEQSADYLQRRVAHRNRLHDLTYAFILRVNVIGSAGTSPLLPHMAAATFMGPLRDKDDNGGYEVMQAISGHDWKLAMHNLTQVDVAHWGYSTVPESQCKLRYAVGEREAAHMFRFPIPNSEGVPGMKLIEGRAVPPPSGMASQGTVLGVSTARVANAMPVRVVIGDIDRSRHLYVVGKTGTGKSTLLSSLILQDIHAGKAVCLLDPHGDLVEDILLRIPDYRADDVILIDPSDEAYPIGLNILNPRDTTDKAKIVNNFIGMLMRLYDPHNHGITGPIFQSWVRNALLAVMDTPGSSLADVYRILTNVEHIKKFIPNITDPVVKSFWEEETKRSGNYSSNWRSELIPYLTSKFSRFVEDPVLRRMLSQSEHRINWFEAIQSRKIIILNLAKGLVGAETSQFLGLLLLSQILEAVFRRGQLSQRERHDFSLVIDEVQNYSTPLLATIISEGRKFGVNLTIANQFLHQLDGGLREAVFGNIGTLAAMRVGIDDAMLLAREFYPVFTADDLTNLPRFTAATKLLVNGMAARPFTMRTLLPTDAPNKRRADLIRRQSQQRYGTAVALVEQEFAKRFS